MQTIPDLTPTTALTDRRRIDAAQQALTHGLLCWCGRDATSVQIERWLDHLARDPEPFAWSCEDDVHLCGGCRGAGAPKGAGPGAVCPECHGDGEVRA